MKLIRVTLIVSALAVLGGCIAVPVEPGYYGSPDYSAPAYYGPRVYGPSIGIGIYGGGHRHGHRRGYRYR